MSLVHTMTSGGFRPDTIANCVYWLNNPRSGINVTVSSGSVDVWADVISGGVNNVTGTTTTRPTYQTNIQNGLNAILFDGVDDFLVGGPNTSLWGVSGWTVFVVCLPTQNTVLQEPWQVDAVNGSSARATMQTLVTSGFWRAGGRRNDADAFASASSTTQASTTTPVVMSARGDYTNTTLKLYLNDGEIASNTSWLTSGTTPNDNGQVTIGNSGALSAPFKGYIFEFLMYSRTLTLAEQTSIVTYERSKWGL